MVYLQDLITGTFSCTVKLIIFITFASYEIHRCCTLDVYTVFAVHSEFHLGRGITCPNCIRKFTTLGFDFFENYETLKFFNEKFISLLKFTQIQLLLK